MFFLDDGALVYSASDLANAAGCEFAVLRSLDAKLGRIEPLELTADAMLERAARLGDAQELRVLQEFRDRFGAWDPVAGTGVVEIERPGRGLGTHADALRGKREETLTALRTGADVVFQAGFFDGRFGGWADFLVREREAESVVGGPVYSVYDSKLARHTKVTALLQVAAYADQLLAAGLTPADQVHLILGDRSITSHRLADLLPVYRDRRRRLQAMLDSHLAGHAAVTWGDPRYRACGRCEVCSPEIARTRDVLLVAGMRGTQRTRLRSAGITTIDEFAASAGAVAGIGSGSLENLRAQARIQVRQVDEVLYELYAPEVVGALPATDPGDVFFDFEGDPLWAEHGSADWGLEYLFGLVENPITPDAEPVFVPFWAHDRVQERKALVDFLAYVTARRATHPHMHVYHYAAYEKTALLRLAGRHGVGEDVVDNLLRDGVLVDLYATVRASLRVGQGSYSIKKLEPLYMPSARDGEVVDAAASIVEYANACAVRDSGDRAGFDARLQEIARYNEYDCVSTLRLRDWLLARAAEQPAFPATDVPLEVPLAADDASAPERDELAEALREFVGLAGPTGGPIRERTADEQAVALLAASLGYHWREEKPFWWAHFDRLRSDPAEWAEARGTVVVDEVEVLENWAKPAGKRNQRRRLRVTGRLEAGSELRAGASVCVLYDAPLPTCAKTSVTGFRGWVDGATVASVVAAASGPREQRVSSGQRGGEPSVSSGNSNRAQSSGSSERSSGSSEQSVLIIDEMLPGKAVAHSELPMGFGPTAGPSTATISDAIRELATDVLGKLAASPGELVLPGQPALDLMRRVPPRTLSGRALPSVTEGPQGYIDAITEALIDLDSSYLAVQGPPGTGKTYAGSRVIAGLVARGWRIGVVAQSHAVVENMLTAVAEAGVGAERIGKKAGTGTVRDAASSTAASTTAATSTDATTAAAAPWQWLKDSAAFDSFYTSQQGGLVVGGTAWDFVNSSRLPDEGLDLLVIDEAGQFCLANTVAVSGAARNLLLLGDPQQLPQVSQGRHPEPVDRSALGWLAGGQETLPDELGYFLARSWRMHPALCAAVSRLAYEGRLSSMPSTSQRSLEGVEPGVHAVLVSHTGNAVTSSEEAEEVVRQVRGVVGHRWIDPARGADRMLEPGDVVVVAAYNAQVWTVRKALARAGLEAVRVGTVDKFQGQEAPVVIVTTAASAAEDVPRGMEFLLSRNRINVAISRGMWCAILVRSASLTDYLPTQPEGLAELGAFIGVCAGANDEP